MLSIGLLAGAASGCDGFDPSSFDLAGSLGVGENTNLISPPPPPPPKPKPTATPTPVPKPSGPDPRAAYLRRNLAFDSVRSRGIAQVKVKQIPQAVGTFRQAQAMKPKDRSVQMWLDAIRESQARPKGGDPQAAQAFQGYANTLRANPPAQNPYGYNPGYPQPMPGQPYGTAPQLPPPQIPGAAPSPLDPRLVF